MSGRGDNVAVFEGVGGQASRYEAAHMGHIGHQQGSILIADLTEFLVVQMPRIAAHTYR